MISLPSNSSSTKVVERGESFDHFSFSDNFVLRIHYPLGCISLSHPLTKEGYMMRYLYKSGRVVDGSQTVVFYDRI
jgi:hypothetical protein